MRAAGWSPTGAEPLTEESLVGRRGLEPPTNSTFIDWDESVHIKSTYTARHAGWRHSSQYSDPAQPVVDVGVARHLLAGCVPCLASEASTLMPARSCARRSRCSGFRPTRSPT